MIPILGILYIVITIVALFMMRLLSILPFVNKNKKLKPKKPLKVLVVFGSGGHSTEMLKLLRSFGSPHYGEYMFVLAHSDKTTMNKIQSTKLTHINLSSVKWHRIHRSREVKQNWFTTIGTTLYAMIQSLLFIYHYQPDLILCNGPGTCLPLCYNAFLLHFLGIHTSYIIFVESYCRVQSLSLTGILLYPIVNQFLVQWPQLSKKYTFTQYIGQLC